MEHITELNNKIAAERDARVAAEATISQQANIIASLEQKIQQLEAEIKISEAESRLREDRLVGQNSFYECILDNIPADIAVFDAQQRYCYVNP
ncbi:MAG: hypothetical protein LPJ89_05225, partial [Hymenobacteraceae bacterium]|nr:hypothetical protein [Hymenobacteraceae bacterium]